jgi:aryl-alcohol dehydrogenase-like predicted oxidoreductase
MISYRPFGNTSFNVSAIGFGGASISGNGGGYGFGPISDEDSLSLLRTSLEYGINLFDTAPVYGFGKSEEILGRALKPFRDRVLIVSKGGVTWDDRKRIHINNNPKVLQKMLEKSLKNLDTEYIDLYMIHWPDQNIDIRKPMEYLSRSKEDGKIRAIGLCNTSEEDFIKAREIDCIESLQAECNLFNPLPFLSLQSVLIEYNLGFMSWGTLDKGILTGRVTPERRFDPVDARAWAPWWKHEDRTPKYNAMKKINRLLEDNNHTGLELALGYVLQFKELSTALCGIRSKEQLKSAVKALSNLPDKVILDEARSIAMEQLNPA